MTPLGIENAGRPAPLANFRVGSAGWTIPREFGSHFLIEGTHLHRYSRLLNCCEINSSFYRPHKQRTWQRWHDTVPENFLFSVKAPKAITHEARLDCRPEHLSSFLRQLESLKEKLGPILFQLPPSLRFEGKVVNKFLSMLRKMHSGSVMWEPRHESWFCREADDLLDEFEISRVAADPACVPAAASPGGWKGLTYYRLHGSPRRYYSAYSSEFLQFGCRNGKRA